MNSELRLTEKLNPVLSLQVHSVMAAGAALRLVSRPPASLSLQLCLFYPDLGDTAAHHQKRRHFLVTTSSQVLCVRRTIAAWRPCHIPPSPCFPWLLPIPLTFHTFPLLGRRRLMWVPRSWGASCREVCACAWRGRWREHEWIAHLAWAESAN